MAEGGGGEQGDMSSESGHPSSNRQANYHFVGCFSPRTPRDMAANFHRQYISKKVVQYLMHQTYLLYQRHQWSEEEEEIGQMKAACVKLPSGAP